MDPTTFLIVECGIPFEKGTIIALKNQRIILGRKGKQWNPDVSFENVFVSRKHAALYWKNGNFFIEDMDSKHGTFLNNKRLKSNNGTILKHADKISFAIDSIVLSFSAYNLDETFDLTPILSSLENNSSMDYHLHLLKRELVIQDKSYTFSEKEYKCIGLLLQKMQQFVAKDELKECVWPERSNFPGITPDVSSEELNALIYRLRKKTQQSIFIESIRGKGYILSLGKREPTNRLTR